MRPAGAIEALWILMLLAPLTRCFKAPPVVRSAYRWANPMHRYSSHCATVTSADVEGASSSSSGSPSSSSSGSPVVVNIYVNPEIIAHLSMKNNQRKSRVILSGRVVQSVQSLRGAVETKLSALLGLPYRIRAKVTTSPSAPSLLSSDADIEQVVGAAMAAQSSLQLYVQVAPGEFPSPAAEWEQGAGTGAAGTGVGMCSSPAALQAVAAMRQARIDPADAESFTMVSFYAFGDPCLAASDSERAGSDMGSCPSLQDFCLQLRQLWAPFLSLGRVYVANEGVNAQMAVPSNALQHFEAATRSVPLFRLIRLNTDRSVTSADFQASQPFKALHIRVRDQIVADGFPQGREGGQEEGGQGGLDWSRAGREMTPLDWHRALQEQRGPSGGEGGEAGGSVLAPVVLDCRNSYESDVGLFTGALPLNTTFFRESWAALDELLKDTPRDAPILTYCTGGIRCVKVNAYLQQRMGFTNTHRLQGGIINYTRQLEAAAAEGALAGGGGEAGAGSSIGGGEEGEGEMGGVSMVRPSQDSATSTTSAAARAVAQAQSQFRGVNYVFDERVGARITADVLTRCEHCAVPCDAYGNCLSSPCNVRFLQCPRCAAMYGGCCCKACQSEHTAALAQQQLQVQQQQQQQQQQQSQGRMLGRSEQRRAGGAAGQRTDQQVLRRQEQPEQSQKEQQPQQPQPQEQQLQPQEHASTWDRTLVALGSYCELQSQQEPPLLAELRAETQRQYATSVGALRMLSDPLQGRLLALLASLSNGRVLEIGAFTGYSAICLAQGMDGGGGRRVVSCEPDATAAALALRYIDLAGLRGQVDLRPLKGMELIAQLRREEGTFDLVFVDADKKQYKQYVQALMGEAPDYGEPGSVSGSVSVSVGPESVGAGRCLLSEGALLVVDNVLWKGLVLEQEPSLAKASPDPASFGSAPRMRSLAVSLHAFNRFAQTHPQLQPVMLPLRDGLTLIRYSNPQPAQVSAPAAPAEQEQE
ncbi:hypothetical protein B484DRAFT_448110 [Ochromonadaceae sp. CCMP2298]|nr:hypothetical protein B484DRAFT_448110 [Ochromonadaceae sp. CCMP2298]